MGQDQHNSPPCLPASRGRRLGRRVCLRKGCGREFQPARWNQRYCQDPECLRLVRRWQAAKRQRQCRQNAERRQRHCEAQRLRRQRRREQASEAIANQAGAGSETTASLQDGSGREDRAWSRSRELPSTFCDRPGCYEPVRCSCRAPARYCTDQCRLAMRRVLDRERKWLCRNTYSGRFKRQQEYKQRRVNRSSKLHSESCVRGRRDEQPGGGRSSTIRSPVR